MAEETLGWRLFQKVTQAPGRKRSFSRKTSFVNVSRCRPHADSVVNINGNIVSDPSFHGR